MKTLNLILMLGTTALLAAGCVTKPLVLDTVGPSHARWSPPGSRGYLKVYSATETDPIGDTTYYYPHTSYRVFDPAGKLVKFVPNHIGNMDESPAWVALPTGNYLVKAQSDVYGWVTVPVVIEAGITTTVHLQSVWPGPAQAQSQVLVRLPDGRPVGWKYNVKSLTARR